MAVVVLEALAGEGRPAGGGADHEPAPALVPERPRLVARALEPEHRIEDVERDHRLAVGRVRGPGGDQRRHRARLVDPLLEHLAVLRLAVRQHEVRVDRLVALAVGGVDADLLEQGVHAERPRLVRDDRHDPLADAPGRGSGCAGCGRTPSSSRRRSCCPDANSASTAASGLGRGCDRTTRRGSGPPSSLRRSCRYCTSSESGPGWKYGASLSWASGIGSSRRSRKTLSSISVSFFAWWVMLRASTPAPSVQPLTVLARITVGAPTYSVAALYAA